MQKYQVFYLIDVDSVRSFVDHVHLADELVLGIAAAAHIVGRLATVVLDGIGGIAGLLEDVVGQDEPVGAALGCNRGCYLHWREQYGLLL